MVQVNRTTTGRAPRIAYELAVGQIPSDLCVLHRCDQPSCVRPDHLFLGTLADNVADKTRKGRQARGDSHGSVTQPSRMPRGERHGMAKLTAENVKRIRASYRAMLEWFAVEFSVDVNTVRAVVRRKKWRRLS